ncbi:plasmid replication, integration and excision activator [Pengzhenrongella sp.]|jgi:hypothetical protein|uniref:plasmid replication, integration and excision activator n=1 Tax=Pengzhenrongella sp. TaxID=2888820 RepID=UPI002F934D7D
MAIAKRFRIGHDEVFGHGAYLVSPVTPVSDFERSTKESKVQQLDKDTGMPLWSVDVLDADPEAAKKSRTVSVKLSGKVQPVPPAPQGGMPFTLVVFDGLSALPYIDDNGNFARIAWSFKADAMRAPGKGDQPSTASSGSGSSAAA